MEMETCTFDGTTDNIEKYVTCVTKAAAEATVASIAGDIDNFYLLVCGTLVFLMQAGFAMLCAGSVRQKNQKNIMLKNLLDACGGALGFYFLGFGFYQGDGPVFLGTNGFLLVGRDDYASFFFQFAFAATAATIVAGTVAERCKMEAYLCYSLFLTAFVYPVVARAGWTSNGFLAVAGIKDFAGSGIVHMTGGCTALIAAIVLGPRKGRFTDADGKDLPEATTFPPSSVSLQILGTFILWVGWYGFNPGSTLGIHTYGQDAAYCAVTTTLAAAAGCISSMFLNCLLTKMKTGEVVYDLTFAMNGALGGLVGITAAPDSTATYYAVIVGIIAGWVYLGASALLIKLKIDDAVDAVPVHFFCGMWGVIAAALFDEGGGLFTTGKGGLLLANIYLILFVIAWVGGLMTPFFIALNFLGMFRVDSLEEDVGLDISHHGGAAYNLEQPKKEDVDELNTRRATAHGKVERPEVEA